MSNLETLKKQAADLEAKLEESTEQLKNMKAEINRLEKGWEMKCPYENNDDIYSLSNDGEVRKNYWSYFDYDRERFEQGNIFPTKEAAELEAKRRNLLTRFKSFRDECNNGWKPDWMSHLDRKHYISFVGNEKLTLFYTGTSNNFQLFGFFKNQEDCERAIELFGNEIKELFVDGE